MKKSRLGEMVLLGRPGQPFMEVPSGRDRVGMLVAGGLNPPAAAEELGVETSSRAMATLVEYSALAPFASLARRL